MAEKKEQDPKLDHPSDAPSEVTTPSEQEKSTDTPDARVDKGDDSAAGEDPLQGTGTRGFGVPVSESKPEASGEGVTIEQKNKALSKEELLQKPSGTGEVKVGGEEATPSQSQEVLAKAQEILKEYGDQESNIPVDSDYWVLINRHRALAKDEREVRMREKEQKEIDEKAGKE
jgi:hypothetical protein